MGGGWKMNLLMAPMGEKLTVMKIRKGRGAGAGNGEGCGVGPKDGRGCEKGERTNQDRHLTNLGFVEGAELVVIAEAHGDLIVKVKDSRVAIGKDIAKKIMVSMA